MNTVALRPTKPIIDAADLIYESIGRYLECVRSLSEHARRQAPRYESNVEAWVLFRQVIRHIEATTELAKLDLVLLPSALVLARATFEATARILWILHPDEVFEREARYLAHLKKEEEFWDRVATTWAEFHQSGKVQLEQCESLRQFRIGVENLLPKHIQRCKAVPNLKNLLGEIGEKEKYLNYSRLSQFSHGTHAAGKLYRKNLGNSKKIGEFISPELWVEPLECAWWCLAKGGSKILQRLGQDPSKFLPDEFFDTVSQALNKI